MREALLGGNFKKIIFPDRNAWHDVHLLSFIWVMETAVIFASWSAPDHGMLV